MGYKKGDPPGSPSTAYRIPTCSVLHVLFGAGAR